MIVPYSPRKLPAYARQNIVKIYEHHCFWFCRYPYPRLRNFVGDNVGVNLDPSNTFWQHIDPLAGVEELGEAIFHVHAKDTRLGPTQVARNGILDTKEHSPDGNRAWIYGVVGRGHGPDFWRALIGKLRSVGYDGALSIEHEDLSVDPEEGFREAADLLSVAFTEVQSHKQ